MTFSRKHIFTLFIILSVHITLLDLVVANYNNVIFLVDKNLEFKTIWAHLFIVCVSVGFYILLNTFNQTYQNLRAKSRDYMWVVWSILLVLLIGFILI